MVPCREQCPTVTSTLLTPLHPWLPTFPHSKQPFPPLEDTNTPSAHHTHTYACSGQQTTPAGVVGGLVQRDTSCTGLEWRLGAADQEDRSTPLSVLPRRPLEVLLTSLWCRAESSEQSVRGTPPDLHHTPFMQSALLVCEDSGPLWGAVQSCMRALLTLVTPTLNASY